MAKRIRLKVPGVRLNETGYKILTCIAREARAATGLACEPVAISRRDFVQELQMSETVIVRSCHALIESGLVQSFENTLENGGRTHNSYALTALGIEVLRLAEAAVAAGEVGVA